jgi:hypothetical protein
MATVATARAMPHAWRRVWFAKTPRLQDMARFIVRNFKQLGDPNPNNDGSKGGIAEIVITTMGDPRGWCVENKAKLDLFEEDYRIETSDYEQLPQLYPQKMTTAHLASSFDQLPATG